MPKQHAVKFSDVDITGGFWADRIRLNENVTLDAVRRRFEDTGRFSALRCDWKPGDPNRPHFFYDSDVAKWIEAAAYVLATKRDTELEAYVEKLIDCIEKNMTDDGYFNVWFTVVEPGKRFTNRDCHELYCAGHLIEAAVAYYEATGKRRFLDLMLRYAELIDRIFRQEDSAAFTTPGHPEIELALVRLYRCTGDKRWLELSKFFVDRRGDNEKDKNEKCGFQAQDYLQDSKPLREQTEAVGHCVRACYLYSAMADIADEYNDVELLSAARKIFESITSRRMYITGGIGSTCVGEAFTIDGDLPNETAYAETCAAVSLAMFAQRMALIELDSCYADTVERVIYNGFLSGVSLDATSFFYENPLSIDLSKRRISYWRSEKVRLPITRRVEVFECSCCPPNVVRFIEQIGGYVYSADDSTVYIHQYMDSRTKLKMGSETVEIEQKTEYPKDGKIKISIIGAPVKVALRIPGWCGSYSLELKNAQKLGISGGYLLISCEDGAEIALEFDMTPTLIAANSLVHDDAGKAAVMRGPVVYCAEGVDNGDIFAISLSKQLNPKLEDMGFGIPAVEVSGTRRISSHALYSPMSELRCEPVRVKLIPYFAFANRGESDMQVWMNVN